MVNSDDSEESIVLETAALLDAREKSFAKGKKEYCITLKSSKPI
jgi:hypothetical protein